MARELRIGCSGWDYDSWRGSLYPDGEPRRRRLEIYAEHFSTVEVNSTFYRLARTSTVERWVAETPESFRFAVKASRYLTHVRRLQDLDRGFRRFYEPLAPLIDAGRLGPVLWQLPENFHRDDERLRAWLAALPDGLHTIEFRHPSWFCDPVYGLLSERGVALAYGDHLGRAFQTDVRTAPWRFIRFHYGARGRRGNYSATELDAWAERIDHFQRHEDVDVWAYFNNDWEGFAPRNAVRLRELLEA
jgi:uncharacterized protein YecE (DUF72 family)